MKHLSRRHKLHYIKMRKKQNEERQKLVTDLLGALAKVKQLTGLLPICISCRKIRDDKGYWNQIEAYLQGNTDQAAHGICPDCLKKFHPEHYEIRCWEYMECGQETEKTCPAVILDAGRMCWSISGTLCLGERQGEAFTKFPLCQNCEFFIKLNRGEI